MYNIDEINSDVTFAVENEKVVLRIKNFDRTGTQVPYLIGDGETTAESDDNVYSALCVKNRLDGLNVTDCGFTDNELVNRFVRELYLTGLDASKYYFVSQCYNKNGYLLFRISCSSNVDLSSAVVVLQLYTNRQTKGGIYALMRQNGTTVSGLVRLQIDFASLPAVLTAYTAVVNQSVVSLLDNSPSIKSLFESCRCPDKGFLNGPNMSESGVLDELNQLSAIQSLRFWHQDNHFTDGVVYFRGVLANNSQMYLQLYDSARNVHTITLGNTIPAEGVVVYRCEVAAAVTNEQGAAIGSAQAYVCLKLNYDIFDAANSHNVSGLRIENHTLYDAAWTAEFGYGVAATAHKALEVASGLRFGSGVIFNEQGMPYRLSVRNGSVSAQAITYRNVLVLGNSITSHARATGRGWYGYAFGMAASRASTVVGESTDFVSHLKAGLATRYAAVNVSRKNISAWETSLLLPNFVSTLDGVSLTGRDAIIIRLCENVPDSLLDGFYSALGRLVDYIKRQNATADLLLCGSSMSSFRTRQRGEVVKRLAVERHIRFVDVQCEYDELERVGHYTEGFTDTTYTTKALYKITDSGVANHPNDLGHLHIANHILDALYYPMLDREHPVTLVNNSGLPVDCASSWVESGILNVKAAASTVQAAYIDNENVTLSVNVTDHGDGMFTLVMPQYPLTVTVW